MVLSAAISTAAMNMLAGDVGMRMSRKPEIMADAAYLILTQNSRDYTGQFLIDDDVLKQHGVTDLDQYANVPGELYIANNWLAVTTFVFAVLFVSRWLIEGYFYMCMCVS